MWYIFMIRQGYHLTPYTIEAENAELAEDILWSKVPDTIGNKPKWVSFCFETSSEPKMIQSGVTEENNDVSK